MATSSQSIVFFPYALPIFFILWYGAIFFLLREVWKKLSFYYRYRVEKARYTSPPAFPSHFTGMLQSSRFRMRDYLSLIVSYLQREKKEEIYNKNISPREWEKIKMLVQEDAIAKGYVREDRKKYYQILILSTWVFMATFLALFFLWGLPQHFLYRTLIYLGVVSSLLVMLLQTLSVGKLLLTQKGEDTLRHALGYALYYRTVEKPRTPRPHMLEKLLDLNNVPLLVALGLYEREVNQIFFSSYYHPIDRVGSEAMDGIVAPLPKAFSRVEDFVAYMLQR